jgi:hypothetical protein
MPLVSGARSQEFIIIAGEIFSDLTLELFLAPDFGFSCTIFLSGLHVGFCFGLTGGNLHPQLGDISCISLSAF